MKDTICKYCNSVNKHFSFQCSLRHKKESKLKFKKHIAKFSDKKLLELKEYRKLRDQYFLSNPVCEFKGCTSINIELHHKRSRKYYLCDTSIFMSVCRKHHNWIHDNINESKELGYLLQSI